MSSSESGDVPFPDYDQDFIDENQIDLFARALELEDDYVQSPQSSTSLADYFQKTDGPARRTSTNNVELIRSQHDWLPIYKRLKKKKTQKLKNPEKLTFSVSFKIMRYPILILIMSWVCLLFCIYLMLRLYVSAYESLFSWTGQKKKLKRKLDESKNYQEWIENAKILDEYLGLDEWRKEDKYFYYDYKTLRKIVVSLANFRKKQDNEQLMGVLQSCLKLNFAGTENPLLYSKTYFGTKDLISAYNEEVVKSLNYIIESKQIPISEKKLFFKIVDKNFGKSALCLSGGATFAYNHLGMIKALTENDLLPKIISGTSGGGVVALLACSRTNEELKQILTPKLAQKITACNEPFTVWFSRWRKTGARFDAVDFARKACWFTKGGLTFKEMYQRTGKKLNISTVPSNPHSPVILCNEITSPNCVVWSSLLASSAVPGILNPVVLMMKDKNSEEIIPFSFGNRWKDGSLRTDIPVEALNNYYNLKFSIVSQVNPHISLFSYAAKGSVGNPVNRKRVEGLRGGFLVASLEHLIKLDITKWLKLIKSLDLFPRVMDQDWSNVWLQKFSGTITVWPKLYIRDLYYILTDPDEKRLALMLRNGELSTYPKLQFIKHRLNIERAIEHGKSLSRGTNLADKEKEVPGFLSDENDEIVNGMDRVLDFGEPKLKSSDDEDGEEEDFTTDEEDSHANQSKMAELFDDSEDDENYENYEESDDTEDE